jgi:hypothetical protein
LLPAGANRRVGLAPTGKRRLVTAHAETGRWSSSEQPRTRHLKSKPFFLRMTMSESGQLNAAPSGILMPWNLITKPAIERYRPVMRGSTDGCLPPSARRGFIADRSARRVRQNGRT